MARIDESVGRDGVNREDDVLVVQSLLNAHIAALGLPPLKVDGDAGDNTIKAIEAYQRRALGSDSPDGRVDPGGRTWQALERGTRVPAAQGNVQKSGAAWWHANQAKYPNSARLADLANPFRTKTIRFTDALRAAGARISVSATRRNRTRAHLMHYSWKVSHGTVAPSAVPDVAGCAIEWDHGNLASSRRGAQAMVDLFGIVHEPSLNSLHIEGRAIDMNVTWDGTIRVRDADGGTQSVGAPRDGNSNRVLHEIGAGYGVLKLLSDPPHWSDNGH